MHKVSTCPDVSSLKKLAAGHLPVAEMESLVQHLEECDACVARVPSLSSRDALVDALTKASSMPAGVDPILARLIERLAKLGQSSAPAPAPQLGRVTCAGCGKTLRFKPELAGKKVKCPGCGMGLVVPAGSPEPEKDIRNEKTILPQTAAPSVGGDAATLPPQVRNTMTGISGTRPPEAEPPPGVGSATESLDFLQPARQADELGRLGQYRILKRLGAGGMGMVLLAEDTMLHRKVALKLMLPQFAANPSARERFLREARSAASIEHEHIVPIFQVGEDNGVPFLAMPFLKGEPLDVRLEREKKLPLAEALRIAREMALGLAAAHGNKLIHRDIKPGNVWLETTSGRKPKVRLLDFGLARQRDDTSNLTQAGAVIGTPAFMAPEQARSADVDARADLFSLGCVLYVMLTGERPFKGNDTLSLLMALAVDNPPEPAVLNPEVPRAVSALTMRLLAKDPNERPASAEAAAEALNALADADRSATSPPVKAEAKPAGKKKEKSRSAVEDEDDRDAPKPGKREARSTADADEDSSTGSPRRAEKRTRKKSRAPLLIAAGIAVVFLGTLAVFAPAIYRIATNQGELIVEVEDPNIEVLLRQDGVVIRDKTKQRNFLLTAKNGDIEFLEDGVKVLARSFHLTANGETRVKVSMAEIAAAAKQQAAAKTPNDSGGGNYLILELGGNLTMKLVRIEPGKFTMGSPKDEIGRQDDEGPQHEVEITQPFYMGVYPVTQAQYQSVIGKNPSYFSPEGPPKAANDALSGKERVAGYDTSDFPVECVSWNDAMEFCRKLEKRVGKKIDLPTEAEWEFACRAGTQGPYNVGDALTPKQANIGGNEAFNRTTKVGSYEKNGWGLYDMHGNLWQYCKDWYRLDSYTERAVKDPQGPPDGDRRVMRGGSWMAPAERCRSARRGTSGGSDFGDRINGFRVVVRSAGDIPQKPPSNDTTTAVGPASPRRDYLILDMGGNVTMKLVRVEPGKFIMGSPKNETARSDDEGPQHEVEISQPFYMGIYPVTQAQYQRVMGKHDCYFSPNGPPKVANDALSGKERVAGLDTSDFPVECVPWHIAMEFCGKLSEKAGKKIDLPTEAEWEYACRAGTKGAYFLGDSLAPKQANFWGSEPFNRTTKVGSYQANRWGLYDMHGNIGQFCKDWYRADYYTEQAVKDPQGPPAGDVRVFRGGSWMDSPLGCRSGRRARSLFGDRNIGFRVVVRIAAAKQALAKPPDHDKKTADPPAAGQNEDFDRNAALWALNLNGRVWVQVPGENGREIDKVAALPSTAFRLLSISVENQGQKVRNDDLKILEGLKGLTGLNLGYTSVSNAGLVHLE